VPHLRDGFIVDKVGHRAKRDPLSSTKQTQSREDQIIKHRLSIVEGNIRVETIKGKKRGPLISRQPIVNALGKHPWRPMVGAVATGTVLFFFWKQLGVSASKELLRAWLILIFLASDAILILHTMTFSIVLLRRRREAATALPKVGAKSEGRSD
jgi:hypothetical protein